MRTLYARGCGRATPKVLMLLAPFLKGSNQKDEVSNIQVI